ncbi:MAG: thioredoxin family protein [Flaviaesturariibacter sp.]|nr:thioredoxin family protein [Flaviaesturariibacter sp.]
MVKYFNLRTLSFTKWLIAGAKKRFPCVACPKFWIMRWFLSFLLLATLSSHAGDTAKLYNPAANVAKDLSTAVSRARREGKHVMIQVGGNWCIWCYRFNGFVESDPALKRYRDSNYIVYHLNYSKENRNLPALKKLGFPQRFGFPVFVILDGKGNRLHTQNSSYLELDKGYDAAKVKEFFMQWAPAALDEKAYREQ